MTLNKIWEKREKKEISGKKQIKRKPEVTMGSQRRKDGEVCRRKEIRNDKEKERDDKTWGSRTGVWRTSSDALKKWC